MHVCYKVCVFTSEEEVNAHFNVTQNHHSLCFLFPILYAHYVFVKVIFDFLFSICQGCYEMKAIISIKFVGEALILFSLFECSYRKYCL
jgi:hypothetical protein